MQIAVWQRNQLNSPVEVSCATYTTQNLATIPDLILRDGDIFLPHEIPAVLFGGQWTVPSGRLRRVVEHVLRAL